MNKQGNQVEAYLSDWSTASTMQPVFEALALQTNPIAVKYILSGLGWIKNRISLLSTTLEDE